MVVAVDSDGTWGSSTYSVGIERFALGSGSIAFGPSLEYQDDMDVYSFCLEYPVAGVAHVLSGLWKYHSSLMPREVYNAQIEQGFGYQVSTNELVELQVIEIGY